MKVEVMGSIRAEIGNKAEQSLRSWGRYIGDKSCAHEVSLLQYIYAESITGGRSKT